jgi:regulatory protein
VAQTWRVTERRQKHDRPALDAGALEALALSYVGRYATSRAGLVRYLRRKLRERGWDDEASPDPEGLAARLADLRYVDDAALAGARGRSLARRGMGVRRLGQTLDRLGIAGEDRAEAIGEAAANAWDVALRFAERRRLGPFAAVAPDEKARARAFAAMMRAGHRLDHARRILAAEPGIVPEEDD